MKRYSIFRNVDWIFSFVCLMMIKPSLIFVDGYFQSWVYLLYWKITWGGRESSESWCRKRIELLLYSFDRDFNEKIQLWLLRFLWYDIWHMFLLCLILSLLCLLFHCIIISRWMLLSRRPESSLLLCPGGAFSVCVSSSVWEGFIIYALFGLSTVFHSIQFQFDC